MIDTGFVWRLRSFKIKYWLSIGCITNYPLPPHPRPRPQFYSLKQPFHCAHRFCRSGIQEEHSFMMLWPQLGELMAGRRNPVSVSSLMFPAQWVLTLWALIQGSSMWLGLPHGMATLCHFSRVQLFATRQAPLSMGFSRQEYWSGLPFPPPGNILNPGIKSVSHVSSIGRGILYH